jgi:ribosomal-protein-alanine N-acetyltransferase
MKVRLAQESDLPQLRAMSEAADSAAQWTQQQWLAIFHTQAPTRLAWIVEDEIAGGNPMSGIGFLVAQNGGPEWELENIAVLPAFRRRGAGLRLLSALLAAASSLSAEQILLEVRVSNQSAIQFYVASGFQFLARRRGYYGNPAEDALILVHRF